MISYWLAAESPDHICRDAPCFAMPQIMLPIEKPEEVANLKFLICRDAQRPRKTGGFCMKLQHYVGLVPTWHIATKRTTKSLRTFGNIALVFDIFWQHSHFLGQKWVEKNLWNPADRQRCWGPSAAPPGNLDALEPVKQLRWSME